MRLIHNGVGIADMYSEEEYQQAMRPDNNQSTNMTTTTPLPTVHRNGTSRTDLADGWNSAGEALQDFIKAYEQIEFNSRDYYVQGPEAWSVALEHRREMNLKIRELMDYIDDHRSHLQP
jgi:hypothetical protein